MYSLGAKLSVVCVGLGEVSNLSCERRHCSLHHLLIVAGVLRETNPILYIGEIFCYPTSHLPLGVTNEGEKLSRVSKADQETGRANCGQVCGRHCKPIWAASQHHH